MPRPTAPAGASAIAAAAAPQPAVRRGPASTDPLQRPRLRGRLHLCTAVASVAGLVWLVSVAATTQALIAAWIYGLANIALYTTSSTYHVFTTSPRARRIMQSLDHAMIYVLIAGTFTPVCILAMTGSARWVVLAWMWAGALVGMALTILALERFHKVTFAMYLVLGWSALAALPALLGRPEHLTLVIAGGVLYTVGAILFGLKRPALVPDSFGYHEVWHLLGVTAGVLLFAVNLDLIATSA